MARVDTFCIQGRGNRLCAWQVREQLQVFGHKPRLDPHTALVRVIIHHSSGSYFAWPGCLHCMSFLFARTLHLPVRTLPSFVFLPACLCWQILRACENVWCLRGPLVRKYPALVCACLPCACLCTLSALGRHPQLQSRPLGDGSPPQSWARSVDTYDWRAAASILVDFVLTASLCMHHRDPQPIPSHTQHPYMQQSSTTHSHTNTACQHTW